MLFAMAVAGVVFIHAGANLANEYFDHVLGADRLNPRPSRLFGGSGSIQDGLVTARSVLIAAVACLAVGATLGLGIVFLTRSIFVLAVGVVGIAGAWCYTAPPLKLAYRTFGELAIAFLFGILPVWTSYYIQTDRLDLVPLIPALIAAILIFEVILANEFPDAPTDAAAGKRTIVVRFGIRTAAFIYQGAMVTVLVLAATAAFSCGMVFMPAWLLFGILTAPLGFFAMHYLDCDFVQRRSGQFRCNNRTIVLYHFGLLVLSLGLVAARYYAAITR